MGNQILEGALGLAAQGIPVIPLRPRSKIPVHKAWPKLGTLDPLTIRLEWSLNPDSNVGVLCGQEALHGDGLVVLDIDEPDGWDTLERLALQLPDTLGVSTPHNGQHHYYRGRVASWNPGPGLEVRANGRQCAAPPSVLADGGYEWAPGHGQGRADWIEPAPDWMFRPDRPPAPKRQPFTPTGLCDPVLEIPPPDYFRELCGLVPDQDGFVCCPLPGHREIEPSCRVYPTADRGWFCYGESCRQGGDIVTLAALLAELDTPVCGYRFIQTLDYLRGRFS